MCAKTSALPACSSKILTQEKQHFAELAVDAIMRLKGSGNLESIHIIKKPGGTLKVGSQTLRCGKCRSLQSSMLLKLYRVAGQTPS